MAMTAYQWSCVAPIALMFFGGGIAYYFIIERKGRR